MNHMCLKVLHLSLVYTSYLAVCNHRRTDLIDRIDKIQNSQLLVSGKVI